VAGVTHKNADGSNRQDIIIACSEGERLELVPEPDNPHSKDRTAVKVCRRNGAQLGYIPAQESPRVSVMFQKGYKLWAVIRAVTGGTDSKPTLGVNIAVRWLNTRTLKRMANEAAGIKPKVRKASAADALKAASAEARKTTPAKRLGLWASVVRFLRGK